MGLAYRRRPVDLPAGVEKDAEFLAPGLVTRQLARSPYLAGGTFTAADISVTYALELAQRAGGVTLGDAEQAYVARTSGREAYKGAMETCQATKAWAAKAAASQ